MRSKNAVRNVIMNLILQLVSIVYGFIVPKVIINYFGSDINGLISSITQFLAYIALLESGFGPVVKATLYKPIAKKDKTAIAGILKTAEKFFRRIAVVFIAYIIILCCVFPFIAKADFDAFFTVSLVVIIGISTFAEYFFGMTYRLFLQAKQKMYVVSIIQVVTYIMSAIAVVVLALIGSDVLIIKLVSGLIFVLRPLVQNIYVKKKYEIGLTDAPDNYPIKQKWDGLAQHIAAVIHNNTDITVLTIFTNFAEVSVYAVYHLIVAGVKKMIQAFSNGLDASFGDMIAKKEEENLRKKFSLYELLYIMITTTVFTITLLMITPFVSVYTKGVTDADYMRPVFGYLLVISEFIWAIRLPYNSITLAAGHFRETRKGAWFEAVMNIVLSVALVFHFGLVGVAIGTIVAMTVRTVEFVYHANKYILKRNVLESIIKIAIAVLATTIMTIVAGIINLSSPTGYITWLINALIITCVTSVVVFVLFFAVYKKELVAILKNARGLFKKKGKNI